jgi:hypothetical protein
MASSGDAARARRRAQRRNAANVRSGRYQPQFRAETARARAAATRVEQRRQGPPQDDIGTLKARIKAKKARAIGDRFKFDRRASDRAVDKFDAPPADYYEILAMSDERLREYYDTPSEHSQFWDYKKFLFYH